MPKPKSIHVGRSPLRIRWLGWPAHRGAADPGDRWEDTMIDMFSDAVRRDPYAVYDELRQAAPVLHVPPPFNGWMIFDYEGVKRALQDHGAFSSQVPFPREWFLFSDPPDHTKLRALISRAFTPRT